MAKIVTVKLTVFIPSEAVNYSVLGYGGAFNGGIKCEPNPSIDLDVNGAGSLSLPTPSWGISRKYNEGDTSTIGGKPDWFRKLNSGAIAVDEKRLDRTVDNLNATFSSLAGASHAIFFKVDGANPLLTFAPAIDAEITVGLRKAGAGIQYAASGSHDGFPNYKIEINGAVIYNHDCVAKGETPSALKPPMDYNINIAWQNL